MSAGEKVYRRHSGMLIHLSINPTIGIMVIHKERVREGDTMHRIAASIFMVVFFAFPCFGRGTKDLDISRVEASAPTVRLGALKGPTGIGMIHLFEGTTKLPRGASLSIEAIGSTDTMVARLLSGELDVAVLPVNIAAKLYNSGVDYRLLAIVGNGMVKMVSTSPAIRSISDLRGRTVHVAGQGATPEFLFRTIVKHEGLDPDKDMKLVFSMPYPEIAASIAAGRIENAVLPEPFATLAFRGNPSSREAFSLTGLWKATTGQASYPMSVFVAKGSLVDKHQDILSALMTAYGASIQSVLSDPVAAGILVEKHDLGLKAAIATASIPSSEFVFIPASNARTSVEALLSVFLALSPNSIGSKLPDEAFYVQLKR